MFAQTTPSLDTLTISIHGKEIDEIGLSCGGQAAVLLQPVGCIPDVLWDLLASPTPVALVTRIEGAGAGPASMVVDGAGRSWGSVGEVDDGIRLQAQALVSAGRSATRRIEAAEGLFLVEAWVPSPRLVVVGSGDLVTAISAQAGLLGWDTKDTDRADDVEGLLDWAGTAAALIVLSHNPHVDTPALTVGLDRDVRYVGALGFVRHPIPAARSSSCRRPGRHRAGPDPFPDRAGPRRPSGARGRLVDHGGDPGGALWPGCPPSALRHRPYQRPTSRRPNRLAPPAPVGRPSAVNPQPSAASRRPAAPRVRCHRSAR